MDDLTYSNLRVRGFTVVLWTVEGQTAEASLDVVAGLSQGAVVGPGGTLVYVCNPNP